MTHLTPILSTIAVVWMATGLVWMLCILHASESVLARIGMTLGVVFVIVAAVVVAFVAFWSYAGGGFCGVCGS